ncbi:hypothetical protein FNAPI_10893 [Fusarium napiforme]|uniref:Uncharacterized protein n=1 Tax=Fusarium napiforme TaxID=42672 RepID=A0A8H5ILX4_9HYPO|nr:hypothetical protein FNAPI_10893 [Fusarium napiforme]
MSFATSAVSPELSTEQYFMTSSFGLESEPAFSTPVPLFQTYDTNSQRLSFAEALHLTQIVDHGKEAANNLNAETQPQYCSLDMLSNKTLSSWQGLVDEAKDVTSVHASETCRLYGIDLTDSLSSGNTFEPSSALLLTYDKDDHFEPLLEIKGGLPPSRAQAITLSPTETCIGEEDGSPCPSMIDSDDSSVEDIEVRKAFVCPYFRLDPVRHIECLSRKLYRIQDVKQHLYRRHYMTRDKSSDAKDNTRGVNIRTQSILKLRLDRRLSPERQWHKIWETLFNLKLPREGPYLGNSKEEIVGSMIAALSDERSNDMETEETQNTSTCGGVDSIPMTPNDMEFEFDFNIPLDRSPSPEIQNSYPSKDITQMQESSAVMPARLSDYSTFEGNRESDISMGYQSTEHLKTDVQVKPAWTPHTALGTLKTVEGSDTAGACGNSKPDGKSLNDCAPVHERNNWPGSWEPGGASSDKLCINYPCPGRFPGYYGSAYKTWVRREWGC